MKRGRGKKLNLGIIGTGWPGQQHARSASLKVKTARSLPCLSICDAADSFELQLRNFLGAIAGRAEPVNSAGQAVQLMEMLGAIYASSRLGREVPIG